MLNDPQPIPVLSKAEIINLAERCQQPSDQLKLFLNMHLQKSISPEICFDSAKVLLKVIIIGLDQGILPLANVQQIKDNIEGSIKNGNISLSFWNELSKKEQDGFHNLQKEALAKISSHNDGTINLIAIEKMEEVTNANLKYFRLKYVDLSSEQIVTLFIKANRPTSEVNAVRSLLKMKENPEQVTITPKEIGIAGITLAYRADRRLNSHRQDSITCHQALQLIELAINAFSLLGKESGFPNIDLGDDKTANLIKDWAQKEKIWNPIESVGNKATTSQDRDNFLDLREFYRETFAV